MGSTGAILLEKYYLRLHNTFILPNRFGYGEIFPAASFDGHVTFYGNAHLGLDDMFIFSPKPHADELAKFCLMFDRYEKRKMTTLPHSDCNVRRMIEK
jgi:hypothetical protein